MIKQIDHYYISRFITSTGTQGCEPKVTYIVWKYTWLDGSKYYYRVETNDGYRYLLTFDTTQKGKNKNNLFFALYKRISKLKGRLLW